MRARPKWPAPFFPQDRGLPLASLLSCYLLPHPSRLNRDLTKQVLSSLSIPVHAKWPLLAHQRLQSITHPPKPLCQFHSQAKLIPHCISRSREEGNPLTFMYASPPIVTFTISMHGKIQVHWAQNQFISWRNNFAMMRVSALHCLCVHAIDNVHQHIYSIFITTDFGSRRGLFVITYLDCNSIIMTQTV